MGSTRRTFQVASRRDEASGKWAFVEQPFCISFVKQATKFSHSVTGNTHSAYHAAESAAEQRPGVVLLRAAEETGGV